MTHAGNVDDATAHAYGPRRTAYQQCLQKAQLPGQRASQVVQTELNDFQGRLQRAIATCQDDVKDGSRAASDHIPYAVAASRTDHNAGGYSDQNRAQNVFNNCVGKVFDAHAGMLGDVKKRIEKGLR